MKCLVLVPGIMGSELRDDEGKVWPPSAAEVVFGYGKLDRLMSDDTVPTGIISSVSVVAVYETLLDDIRRCGYVQGSDERRFIPFPYDWRRSNRLAAEALVARLDAEFDVQNDDLDITLVAHSMGGLVCRYLLESGEFAERPWISSVRRLITLGTPHRGAPAALQHLAGDKGKLGLSGTDIRTLANDPRFPSLYELAGHAKNGFAMIRERPGEIPAVIDPLGPEIAELIDLNIRNIATANAFWSVMGDDQRPESTGCLCVAGSAFKTTVRSEIRARTDPPIPIVRKNAGDETVPFLSGALPGLAQLFSRKKHGTIFEDRDVREVLYRVFDAPANVRPQSADDAAEPGSEESIGISTSAESYGRGEPIEVAVSFNREVANPNVGFQIIAFDPNTGQRSDDVEPADIAASFTGTGISSFSFTIANDLEPGLYELRPYLDIDDPVKTFFYVEGEIGATD